MPTTATQQYNKAIFTLTSALGAHLPPPPATLPPATITLVRADERSVGIGRRTGMERRGDLGPIDVHGGRVDAVVRFELWSDTLPNAAAAALALQQQLRADADALRAAGFQRLVLRDTSAAELVPGTGVRQTLEYAVLYEYRYLDPDDDASLIARIPITIDGELHEHMRVTDSLTRWDELRAPPLVLRGPLQVGVLSLLAFLPVPQPTGAVTLTRTFDAATGAATVHATLAGFLTAVGGDAPAERHATTSFATAAALVAAGTPAGDDLALGDWNLDGAVDLYVARTIAVSPAIALPTFADRLELSYATPPFDNPGVLYARASRTLPL